MPSIGEIQNMKVGIWDYTSGIDGTVDLSALAGTEPIRVVSITAVASGSGGTVQVDNRTPAIIPADQSLTLTPGGTITNNVIIFTDTVSYVIEFVTNNRLGSTEGDI